MPQMRRGRRRESQAAEDRITGTDKQGHQWLARRSQISRGRLGGSSVAKDPQSGTESHADRKIKARGWDHQKQVEEQVMT